MPRADDIPSASFGLAAGLCLIALFLGLRQWYERRARESNLSPADEIHFWHQDTRRRLGVGVLLAISLLALTGSRIEPKAQGQANLLFVGLWFVVLALILVLLGLALADLLATRAYARRHRKQLIRESIAAIRRDVRQYPAPGRDANDEPTDLPTSSGPD